MVDDQYKALLAWYHQDHRRLPWRDSTDPYHIWISEIMLQQTQVKTVLPRYSAWFKRFPSIATLADAHLDDVLKAWEGLGYYRRARFIHQAAQRISDQHNGIFPTKFEAIMALPGIGQSTAGAIASFCFSYSTPVLDANVKRVLKRWNHISTATDKTLWPLAQQAIDASSTPAIWNQAMMELGATLCTAKKTDCQACPVHAFCASAFHVDFMQEKQKTKTVPVHNVHWQVDLHIDPDKGLWLSQRPAAGIWGGLWTPPITELQHKPESKPDHIHLLTHRRLHLYAQTPVNKPNGAGIWVSNLDAHALPTGIHRLFSVIAHKFNL